MNPAEFVFENAESQPEKVADILNKIHEKGESVSQILDFIAAAKKRRVSVKIPVLNLGDQKIFDVCGTGGTGKKRINISTALAIKLSQKIISRKPEKGAKWTPLQETFTIGKHGNRAASGKVGSFDLIESLGYEVGDSPEKVQTQIETKNLSFLFAPAFHPALKPLAPIRKSLGHPTVFNYLGPLLNPIENLTAQMTGVSSPAIGQKLAEVCQKLKQNILLVYDKRFGLDDVSIGGQTQFWEVLRGHLKTGFFNPEDYGMTRVSNFAEIAGTDSIEQNKIIFQNLLSGEATKSQIDFLEMNRRVAVKFFQKF